MTYEEQIEQWYLSADSAFGLRSKDIEALAKILIASQGQEQLPVMNRKMRLVYWAYNAWMVTKPELTKTEENG